MCSSRWSIDCRLPGSQSAPAAAPLLRHRGLDHDPGRVVTLLAAQINRCVGPSGSNREYVIELAWALRGVGKSSVLGLGL